MKGYKLTLTLQNVDEIKQTWWQKYFKREPKVYTPRLFIFTALLNDLEIDQTKDALEVLSNFGIEINNLTRIGIVGDYFEQENNE